MSKSGNNNNNKNCFIKECEKKRVAEMDHFNDDNWVPIDVYYILIYQAYNCARDYKSKYNIELSDNFITDLLGSVYIIHLFLS